MGTPFVKFIFLPGIERFSAFFGLKSTGYLEKIPSKFLVSKKKVTFASDFMGLESLQVKKF